MCVGLCAHAREGGKERERAREAWGLGGLERESKGVTRPQPRRSDARRCIATACCHEHERRARHGRGRRAVAGPCSKRDETGRAERQTPQAVGHAWLATGQA